MKKLFIFLLLTECLFNSNVNVLAQGCSSWCLAGNTIGANDYLGGDGITTNPLKIKTNTAYPIEFYTNGNPRMVIRSNGNIGIGNFAGFTAAERLHLRESSSNPTVFLMTGNNTGDNATDGFHISLNNSTTASLQSVDFNLQENSSMNFLTNNSQRMIITDVGDVGVGTTGPAAKFHVDYSSTAGGSSSFGSLVTSLFSGTANTNYGSTAATNIDGDDNTNYGLFSSVVPSIGATVAGNTSWGVYGMASCQNDDSAAIGGEFVGGGGKQGYGIRAFASTSANINYAVFASATGTCTSTSSCAAAAGYFSGNLAYTGSLVSPSDASLKINVTPLVNASAIIGSLNPKTFQFDNAQYGYMHLPEGDQLGVIAQELELIYPQFVKNMILPAQYDNQGNMIHPEKTYKGVDYIPFITLLLGGHQEQQQQIADLQAQLAALQNGQKAAPATGEPTGQLKIKLSDENSIVILNQNDPNPFSDNTTITYNIPDDVKTAQILFYNNKGHVINTVDIIERGEGSLLVYGSDLVSGIYTYTLLIDGKPMETLKMMKVK